MNPLNAQQISRIEHSQSFRQVAKKEPFKFLKANVKPFQFLTKVFRTDKRDLNQSTQPNINIKPRH